MVKTYHMRRADKEIKDKKKLARILTETKYVVLALAVDNEPYVVTLSHHYDEEAGCIYFHSAPEGKKLDYMRANPVVWGQAMIDYGYYEGKCTHRFVSAVFRGRVEWVDSLDEKKHAMRLMIERLEPDPAPQVKRLLAVENDDALSKTVMGKIVIEEITGKKHSDVTF